MNNLINIVERYVYLDIIKYPSQPKENYFNIVDLVEKLKNVTTAERPIYGLFREINLIISEYQDNHFSFSYNRGILQGYKLSEMFLNKCITFTLAPMDVDIESSTQIIYGYMKNANQISEILYI